MADDELFVDRTGWGPGPWDDEPDKIVWKTKSGLPGMIVRSENTGALCGYVGVTRDHPFYGKEPDEGVEAQLSVHGGVNFTTPCDGHICHVPAPGEPADVWWIGFDCAHGGDTAPALDRLIPPDLRTYSRMHASYRGLAYVRGEVEDLAEQIAEVGRRG